MWNISDKYLNEIKQAFASDEEFEAFLNSCQLPLKKSIKINLHKISPEEFIKDVSPQGWKLTSPGFVNDDVLPEDVFYVDREDTSIPLWKTFYHQSGFFYIQEVAAGLSARGLFDKDSTGNELVLDMSGAPGWKSVQIWDYLQYLHQDGPLGMVVSNDLSKQRLMATGFNLNRMGIFNSIITNFNGFSFGKNLPEFFDKVLLDAPCSGEWTGFKSDFGLKYWRKEEITKIASTQYQLLVSALKTVKTWWTIIFSTCTMNPYENEFNLKKLLSEYAGIVELEEVLLKDKDPGLTTWNDEELLSASDAEKVARFWPHKQKTGGFFIAKLRKIAPLPVRNPENKLVGKKWLKFSFDKALQKKVEDFLEKNYWIKTDSNKHYFVETGNYVYVTSPMIKDIFGKFDVEKIWTPILKKNKSGQFRPTHHFGVVFWHLAQKNFAIVELDAAYKYGLWNDLEEGFQLVNVDNPPMNYLVLKYKNYGMWVGKLLQGHIKNKYLK